MALAYPKQHGVYEVLDENLESMYIGSTHLKLEWLEDNHRNWQRKNYSRTEFRQALVENGKEWTFRWAEKPRDVSREYIEIVEGALIRRARPKYNRSQYPYERSIHEGRFNEKSI